MIMLPEFLLNHCSSIMKHLIFILMNLACLQCYNAEFSLSSSISRLLQIVNRREVNCGLRLLKTKGFLSYCFMNMNMCISLSKSRHPKWQYVWGSYEHIHNDDILRWKYSTNYTRILFNFDCIQHRAKGKYGK